MTPIASHLVLVFLLLTLNIEMLTGERFFRSAERNAEIDSTMVKSVKLTRGYQKILQTGLFL